MAESVSKPAEQGKPDSGSTATELKQLESQLVSLNFIIKNTQSEVIKLQKSLSRQQTHQEEIDKRLEKAQRELKEAHESQQKLENIRSTFWIMQIGTIIVTLLLVMLFKGVLIGHPTPASAANSTYRTSGDNPVTNTNTDQ